MNTRHWLPLAAALALAIAGCQNMGSESDTSDDTASGTTSSTESSSGSSRRAEADTGTTSGSESEDMKRCADGTWRTECPEDTTSSSPEPATSPGDTSGTPTQTPSPDTGTSTPPE